MSIQSSVNSILGQLSVLGAGTKYFKEQHAQKKQIANIAQQQKESTEALVNLRKYGPEDLANMKMGEKVMLTPEQMSSYETYLNKALNSVQNRQKEKAGHKQVMQARKALFDQPVYLGGEKYGTVSDLPKELQQQIKDKIDEK